MRQRKVWCKRVLELLHSDLCGPITPSTLAGNRYIFVVIDDHSRYMWTMLLKQKSEAFEKFKKLRLVVEQETREKITTFRTDRGGEFVSREFNLFCEEAGIKQHLTAPYTPQQNGVVERRNRTLMEMARSILKHMHMPNHLWGEATRHATYLLNRIATRALKDQTPYEVFRGRKPNINHLRIFGCIAYAKNDQKHLRKLDDRSRMLVHLGTEPGSKAYRLLEPETRKIVVSRDVIFDETKGWNWKKQSTNDEYGEFVVTLGEFGNHGIAKTEDTSQLEDNGEAADVKTNEITDHVSSDVEDESGSDTEVETSPLRRSQRQTTKPKYLEDYVLIAEEEGEMLLL